MTIEQLIDRLKALPRYRETDSDEDRDGLYENPYGEWVRRSDLDALISEARPLIEKEQNQNALKAEAQERCQSCDGTGKVDKIWQINGVVIVFTNCPCDVCKGTGRKP